MKATANLNRKKEVVTDGNDSIVIVNDLGDIPGGRALAMDIFELEGGANQYFPDGVVHAGHVIVKYPGPVGLYYEPVYIPMPPDPETQRYIDTEEFGAQFEFVGVLKHSVPVDNAQAAILTMGQVNAAASPYPVTDAIAAALPRIQFLYRDQDSRLNN